MHKSALSVALTIVSATLTAAASPALAERIGASFVGEMRAIEITSDPASDSALGSVATPYPVKARNAAVGGKALLRCRLGVEGRVSECRVIDEDPPGFDFGEAALAGAADILAPPKGIPGPWPKTVIVPFVFRVAKTEPSSAAVSPSFEWKRTPTGVDLARVFPDRAQRANQEGWAMIKCVNAAEGRITGCKAIAEEPEGWGFAGAAVALADKFRLAAPRGDAPPLEPGGTSIRIPIFFRLPER